MGANTSCRGVHCCDEQPVLQNVNLSRKIERLKKTATVTVIDEQTWQNLPDTWVVKIVSPSRLSSPNHKSFELEGFLCISRATGGSLTHAKILTSGSDIEACVMAALKTHQTSPSMMNKSLLLMQFLKHHSSSSGHNSREEKDSNPTSSEQVSHPTAAPPGLSAVPTLAGLLSQFSDVVCGMLLQALGVSWQHGVSLDLPLLSDSHKTCSGCLRVSTLYVRERDGHLHPAAMFEYISTDAAGDSASAGEASSRKGAKSDKQSSVPTVKKQVSLSVPSATSLRSLSVSNNKMITDMSVRAASFHSSASAMIKAPVPFDNDFNEEEASLERGLSILSHVPLIMTLLDLEGGALYQNDLSLKYWGDLLHPAMHAGTYSSFSKAEGILLTSQEILGLLLSEQSDLVPELLVVVGAGLPWKKVIQVPPTCNFDNEDRHNGRDEDKVQLNNAGSGDVKMSQLSVQSSHDADDQGDGTPPIKPDLGADVIDQKLMLDALHEIKLGCGGENTLLDAAAHGVISMVAGAEANHLHESFEAQPSASPFEGAVPWDAAEGELGGAGIDNTASSTRRGIPESPGVSDSSGRPSRCPFPDPVPSPIPATTCSSTTLTTLHTSASSMLRPSVSSLTPAAAKKAIWEDMPVPPSRKLQSIMATQESKSHSSTFNSSRQFSAPLLNDLSPVEPVESSSPPHGGASSLPTQLSGFKQLSGFTATHLGPPRPLTFLPGQIIPEEGDIELASQQVESGGGMLTALITVASSASEGKVEYKSITSSSADHTLDTTSAAAESITTTNSVVTSSQVPGRLMDTPLHNKANEEASAQNLVRLSIAVHQSQQDKLPIQEEEESIWEVVAWHEVEAVPLLDPVSRKKTLLLLQADISLRVERELKLAALTEAQLSMLEQMFPRHVIEYMIGNPEGLKVRRGDMDLENPAESSSISNNNLATWHQGVTIMFMDIVGFTAMSKEVHPSQVMAFLNALFTLFDELIDQYNVYKVETAGDCYIVAGALMSRDDEGFLVLEHAGDSGKGARQVMAFAKAILRCAKTVTMPHNGKPTVVRVGMHTGPVVTGLIGTKLPKFSIFGDTMNTASRMESTSQPGCIHVTEDTQTLLTPYTFKPTGGVDVKGKGLMNTFLWDPEEHPDEQYTDTQEQAQEASALIKHISKSMHRSKISKPRPPTIFTHTAEAAVLLSKPLSMLPIGSPPMPCNDTRTSAPSILSCGTGVATQASSSSGIAAVEGGQDDSSMVSTLGLAVLQHLPGQSVQKGTGLLQEVQMRLEAVSVVSRHSAAGPIVSSHRHMKESISDPMSTMLALNYRPGKSGSSTEVQLSNGLVLQAGHTDGTSTALLHQPQGGVSLRGRTVTRRRSLISTFLLVGNDDASFPRDSSNSCSSSPAVARSSLKGDNDLPSLIGKPGRPCNAAADASSRTLLKRKSTLGRKSSVTSNASAISSEALSASLSHLNPTEKESTVAQVEYLRELFSKA